MSLSYDVIVVGGGPAGAAVARPIRAAGFSVAILERDARVGTPVQCSGLVTHRTMVAAGLQPEMAYNTLTGAAIHAPSGARYEIGGDRVHAYVLDRSLFDTHVMEQAVDSGCELFTGTRVTALRYSGTGVTAEAVRSGQRVTFEARLIIGADGPRSMVAEFLGLPPVPEILRARGADVRLPSCSAGDQVQIFVGSRYAPGFFAWAIPLGGDRFRIGWGSTRSGISHGHLDALTHDFPEIFAGCEILSQTGGLIPLSARDATAGERGMVVGDAAGQAKPTSGGGLYTTLTCARHCATTAIEALGSGDTSSTALSSYDTAWRSSIGQELARATALRRAYRDLDDSDLEFGLRLLRVPGVRYLADRFGDIDYPSRLAAAALRAAPILFRLGRERHDLSALLTHDEPAQFAGADD